MGDTERLFFKQLPKTGYFKVDITRGDCFSNHKLEMRNITTQDLTRIIVKLFEEIAETENKPITRVAGEILAELFNEATPTSL